MRYLLPRKQVGEGCDYTIGCGMTYEFVEYDGSTADAVKHFERRLAYPDGEKGYFALDPDRETNLEEAWLIPADQAIQLDLDRLREEWKQQQERTGRETAEQCERTEYARLKKKFEGEQCQ